MKIINFLLLLCSLLPVSLFGQVITEVDINSTTQEEYNYMTKGYKVQIESGLDTKKGYDIEDAFDNFYNNGTVHIEFKELRRTKNKSLAGIIVIISYSDYSRYLGIPVGNYQLSSSLFEDYAKSLNQLPEYINLRYSAALSQYLIIGKSKL